MGIKRTPTPGGWQGAEGVGPGRPEQEIAAPDWLAARDVLYVCVYLPYHIPMLPVNLMPCLTLSLGRKERKGG